MYLCFFTFKQLYCQNDTETEIKKHVDKKNEYINEIKNLIVTTKESIGKHKLLQTETVDQNPIDDKNNKKVF